MPNDIIRYSFLQKRTGIIIDILYDPQNSLYYASEIQRCKEGYLVFVPFRLVNAKLCKQEMLEFRKHPDLYEEIHEKYSEQK